VVFNAVLTERVKTGQRLGVLVAFQTDLTHEKLVMYLLSKLRARGRRHLELVLLLHLLTRHVWT